MTDHKLAPLLEELEAAANALQQSLLARDTKCIWSNLARQEDSVKKLGNFDVSQKEEANDPAIQRVLKRCRVVLHANRALTRRFLDVVDQTLSSLGGGSSVSYAGYGAQPRRTSPMLVRQQG